MYSIHFTEVNCSEKLLKDFDIKELNDGKGRRFAKENLSWLKKIKHFLCVENCYSKLTEMAEWNHSET